MAAKSKVDTALTVSTQSFSAKSMADSDLFSSRAMADLHSTILDAPSPPGDQILSISCSFKEILAKSYVGAPLPPESWRPLLGEILDPPLQGTSSLPL